MQKKVIGEIKFRKDEINPLDYIYRAVGSQIRALDASDPMAPVILQYLYNSTDSSEYRVESIYQVRRPAEDASFGKDILSTRSPKFSQNLNRKLHWHGTKAAHLLSILNSGLMINASGALRTGRAYGEVEE